jgi:hypothetical protein
MATIKGGAKLEAYLRDLASRVGKPGTLRVGFLEGATYPDGTSVPLVAAIQNFGAASRGIPPRPYFSNMVADKADGWGPALARILQGNDYDGPAALELMGAGIAGQLRQSIVDTNAPPLAPATIARKGFEKPLIDTSHMLNSVDFEVTGGP